MLTLCSDARDVDNDELYKRLNDDRLKQGLRFEHAEEKMAVGFSSQRILLDRIFDAVQGINNGGVSNEDTREATKIRALERRTTVLATQTASSVQASVSHSEAAALCRWKVAELVRSHRALNVRYVDRYFDFGRDIRLGSRNCLDNLVGDGGDFQPASCQFVGVRFIPLAFGQMSYS